IARAQSGGAEVEAAGPPASVQALLYALASLGAAAARLPTAPRAGPLAAREDGSVHAGSDEGVIEALGKDTARWLERSWDAEVLVDGPLAQVWVPYDFHRDGAFSHCGTNSVTLARGVDGWRIVAIAYTMRKYDCPPGAPAPDGLVVEFAQGHRRRRVEHAAGGEQAGEQRRGHAQRGTGRSHAPVGLPRQLEYLHGDDPGQQR